jgi:thiol-disulfide isomerase/thioredoxin
MKKNIEMMKMAVKIFWQDECPHCPKAKEIGEKLEKKGIKVEYFDIKSIDGLAEAAYFSVMSTPSLIITDDNNREIFGWRGQTPDIKDLEEHL